MIKYFYFPNQQKIALQKASEKLNESLKLANEENKKVLLLLSGGSCLDLLSGIDTKNLNKQITISPLDERYSTNPKENNMAQIANTNFYKTAILKECKFIDTRVKKRETQEELTIRFNSELNNWLNLNPKGIIVATIGIGPDDHISGIMPYPENPEKFSTMFDNGIDTCLVIGYDAGGKNQYPKRITTTINMLRKINTVIVYMVGENKKKAFDSLQDKAGDLPTTPARILREIKASVFVFTNLKRQKNIGS